MEAEVGDTIQITIGRKSIHKFLANEVSLEDDNLIYEVDVREIDLEEKDLNVICVITKIEDITLSSK